MDAYAYAWARLGYGCCSRRHLSILYLLTSTIADVQFHIMTLAACVSAESRILPHHLLAKTSTATPRVMRMFPDICWCRSHPSFVLCGYHRLETLVAHCVRHSPRYTHAAHTCTHAAYTNTAAQQHVAHECTSPSCPPILPMFGTNPLRQACGTNTGPVRDRPPSGAVSRFSGISLLQLDAQGLIATSHVYRWVRGGCHCGQAVQPLQRVGLEAPALCVLAL